jgi:hypothetical protein
VTGAIRRAWDRIRGGGDHSVTVPPMDGALNPNNRLDQADIVAAADAPDNLCVAGAGILFSSGASVLRLDRSGGSSAASPFASFDSAVTSVAALGDAVAVGLAGGQMTVRGGPHDALTLNALADRPLGCVTALAFADPHTLLLCQGSARHAASEWKHDLMQLGSSGSVWRIDLSSRETVCIADRLAFPFGIMTSRSGAILVTESWRHRLLSFASQGTAPEVVLADLPAYPARISAAADGRGAWLCLFAPRRQLTEFVLREPGFRERMMAEVAPDHWVGPTLAPMKSFLEPLQGGTLKKLAAIKPWAPSRSYGLIARLDETYQPESSFHSRADGTRHGITSAVEVDGRLLASSRGCNAVVDVALGGSEG